MSKKMNDTVITLAAELQKRILQAVEEDSVAWRLIAGSWRFRLSPITPGLPRSMALTMGFITWSAHLCLRMPRGGH